jgi:hypothetical protein
MLVFPIAGTLGDFYQRRYAARDHSGYKNKVLQLFCVFSIALVPVFMALRFDLLYSCLAALFLYFYSRNNLIQRRIYNKLSFSESIRYNFFRSIPFLLLSFLLIFLSSFVSLFLVIFLALLFEASYFLLVLRPKICALRVSFRAIRIAAAVFFGGAGFVLFLSTLGGAYLQRGEVTMAGTFWAADYSMVAMVCTLANVFIIPISMITSTPLMSLLVHLRITLSRVRRLQIAALIFICALFVGMLSYLVFPSILVVFYGTELSPLWRVSLAVSLFSLTIFFATRTLIAKYSSAKNIFLVNLAVAALTIPLLFFSGAIGFLTFWLVFSFARAFAPLALFVFERDFTPAIGS